MVYKKETIQDTNLFSRKRFVLIFLKRNLFPYHSKVHFAKFYETESFSLKEGDNNVRY